MKVRFFVTGSAALLAVWLIATFLNEVPADTYNQFGRGSVPLSAKRAVKPEKNAEKPVVARDKDEVVPVSRFE